MVLSGIVFWNGMFILCAFKHTHVDLIPVSSDYKGTNVIIRGMFICYMLHSCWQVWKGGGKEGGSNTMISQKGM